MFKNNSRFYRVGQTNTHDKTTAIMESEKTGHHIFYTVPDFLLDSNMSIEPVHDMWTLCTEHALRIRKTYDYVRLFYSGGCDSHYMLRVFVENKIHIDEIVMHNSGIPSADYEVNDIAVPYVMSIKQCIPDTKIQILSKDIIDYYNFYDSPYWFEKYINIGRCKDVVYIRLNNWLESINIYKQHGKTANVHGEGKPLLCYVENQWYTYFLDCEEYQYGRESNDYVCFFNDDVKVYIKQCHLLKNSMLQKTTTDFNNIKKQPGWEKFLNESIQRVDTDQYYIPHVKNPMHKEYKSMNIRELIAKKYLHQYHPKVYQTYKEGIAHLNSIGHKWWNNSNPELGSVGCLSSFICLNEHKIKTVEELFPTGFNL